MAEAPRVLALVGPTAAGKSLVALEAAERLDAEIVAVDAFTVYRGMDVGTAKPSSAERRRVPHHLVDLLEPEQECTVQLFQQAARAAISRIAGRGRIALLVGGSGLYFRAVVDPLEFPPTDAALRAALERRYAGEPAAAHATLKVFDPPAADRIHPANLRRSVRALEVLELTGRPFSAWRRAWDHHHSIYAGLQVVGIDLDRGVLNRRIAERVEGMFDEGFVAECQSLRGRPLSTTAAQAIGYAEVYAHLRGECTLGEARERTVARTRRYAARQQRWFRADPRVRWAAPEHALEVLTG